MKKENLFSNYIKNDVLINGKSNDDDNQIVHLKSFEDTISTLNRLVSTSNSRSNIITSPSSSMTSLSISSDQLWPCDGCNKIYKSKTSLSLHKRVECGKEPNQQCKFCFRTFYHVSSLNRHIRLLHRDLVFNNEENSKLLSLYTNFE